MSDATPAPTQPPTEPAKRKRAYSAVEIRRLNAGEITEAELDALPPRTRKLRGPRVPSAASLDADRRVAQKIREEEAAAAHGSVFAPSQPGRAPQALYTPWPKQRFAFDLIWREHIEQLLYGGAAGGGKSNFVRMIAATLAVLWPGSVVGIFRRTDQELQANHVSKWLAEVDPFVPGGRFFQQKMEYHWPSPAWCWCTKGDPCAHSSVTAFRHIDDNRGAKKHQGAEFAAQLLDEATHFKGPDIDFLYTRVRADADKRNARDLRGPDSRLYHYPGWPGWLKLQVLTANPGDVGEAYMIANYIDPDSGIEAIEEEADANPKSIVAPPAQIVHPDLGSPVWEESVLMPAPTNEDGTPGEREERYITVDMKGARQWTIEIDLGLRGKVRVNRAFIPSKLEDNPSLDPEEYAGTLAVGSKENLRRLLDGDWSYSADRIFQMLQRDTHLVDTTRAFGLGPSGIPNPPPIDYPRGIGLDHGTAKPTAAVWVCREDEGFYIAYKEYYSPGSVTKHIREIRDLMDWDGHPNLRPQSDPQMWRINQNSANRDESISVATIYQYGGDPPVDPVERRLALERGISLAQSKISDAAALMEMESMLEISEERLFPSWHPLAGRPGAPLLFISTECPNLWRELTLLKRPGIETDGAYGEGIKNGQPDHAYDAVKRIAGTLRKAMYGGGLNGTRVRRTFSYSPVVAPVAAGAVGVRR